MDDADSRPASIAMAPVPPAIGLRVRAGRFAVRWLRRLLVLGALVGLGAIGYADRATHLDLSLIYAAPVLVMTIALGTSAGILGSFLAVIVGVFAALPLLQGADGRLFVLSVSLSRLGVYSLLVVLLATMVTERRKRRGIQSEFQLRHETLLQLANTDGLTGLSNARGFHASLDAALERTRGGRTPVSLVMLDVDGLKDANDTYGHATGDQLLRTWARSLMENVRPTDTPARLGGDEFAIIAVGSTQAQAVELAERLRSRIAQEVLVFGRVRPTASIGVAQWEPGLTREELVRRADLAMYSAKRHGKNRVVPFSTELRRE